MDRRRPKSPVNGRRHSGGVPGTIDAPSPAMSPAHHHHRSSSVSGISSVKRTQNVAARAAAARLAQVMASQSAAAEDEDGGDEATSSAHAAAPLRYGVPKPPLNGNGGGGSSTARSMRSLQPVLGRNILEPSPSVHSTSSGRPSVSARTIPVVPPSRTMLRTPSPTPVIEPLVDRHREKRFPVDTGHANVRDSDNQRETAALRDELEMLQEENDNILDKLRRTEQLCEEAEARARELEKQVAVLGEGVSLEARLMSKKEAALRQREAALKAVAQTKDARDEEITVLRQEVESARDEVSTAVGQLREAETEVKTFHSTMKRMILTEEEMEEVVLKRCWLARYWDLAVQHGIYPEISLSKHEHWSSLAPLPLEVVISAGQKAKEESLSQGDRDCEGRNSHTHGLSDVTGEGSIESMLLVEKGLRELAALKVEDAVTFAVAQHRRPSLVRLSPSDLKSPGDPKFMEVFDLNQEESDDVLFKQAWLTYFWRRAKTHGVEVDIAEERLQFWIGRIGRSLTSHDAVDVERGLMELRKLGIEQQLWEVSRREMDQTSAPKKLL